MNDTIGEKGPQLQQNFETRHHGVLFGRVGEPKEEVIGGGGGAIMLDYGLHSVIVSYLYLGLGVKISRYSSVLRSVSRGNLFLIEVVIKITIN